MVDEFAVGTCDSLFGKRLSYCRSEMGECFDFGKADFGPLVLNEEEPVSAPCDVAGDEAMAGDLDLLAFAEAIGGHIVNGDRSIRG